MCPDGMGPGRTFGGTALGAALTGMTTEPGTCCGPLSAGTEAGAIWRNIETSGYIKKTPVQICNLDHIKAE